MHSIKIITVIVGIFVLIVFASHYATSTLSEHAQSLEERIDNITINTEKNNWEAAESELSAIEEEWPKVENLWSALLDHEEIDHIDEALKKVSSYVKSKNAPFALAELSVLKQYIKHIPDKEAFNLKNIL